MLRVVDIHTYYGESYFLQGISMEVPEKSLVGIVGRNGMGKTTLIHSINGFVPPRNGEIFFKMKNIAPLSAHQIAQLGVSLVPQGRRIFPSLNVKENLFLAFQNRRNARWNFEKVISLFPQLGMRLFHGGRQLSGGEQQMLAIGRALMGNPDLLLMDEPSEGLAPLLVREIFKVIRSLKEEDISILLVEQNLEMAINLSDTMYVINKGKIVYQGEAQKLRDNAEVKSHYLAL